MTHEPSSRELAAEIKALWAMMDERKEAVATALVAQEKAVAAALAAQEKATAAAFEASNAANSKAEMTAAANDAKNNEFRGQLKDQAATLLPRSEADARFGSALAVQAEAKRDFEKYKDAQAIEVTALRLAGSATEGQHQATADGRVQAHWIIGVILTLVGLVLGYLLR